MSPVRNDTAVLAITELPLAEPLANGLSVTEICAIPARKPPPTSVYFAVIIE
jgi:hypothetical protein